MHELKYVGQNNTLCLSNNVGVSPSL